MWLQRIIADIYICLLNYGLRVQKRVAFLITTHFIIPQLSCAVFWYKKFSLGIFIVETLELSTIKDLEITLNRKEKNNNFSLYSHFYWHPFSASGDDIYIMILETQPAALLLLSAETLLLIIYILYPTLRDEKYTEFNLATWLRLVKLPKLNISKLWFLDLKYISYHWEFS